MGPATIVIVVLVVVEFPCCSIRSDDLCGSPGFTTEWKIGVHNCISRAKCLPFGTCPCSLVAERPL